MFTSENLARDFAAKWSKKVPRGKWCLEAGFRESLDIAVFACSCFVRGTAYTGHVPELSNAYRAVDRAFYRPRTSLSAPYAMLLKADDV